MSSLTSSVGGSQFQSNLYEWSRGSHSLFFSLFAFGLLLLVLFPEKLPIALRWQLSTTAGRALVLLVLYMLIVVAGPIPALLFTIAVSLIWATRPSFKPTSVPEGFQDMKVSDADEEHKWFVEKVLEENPRGIVEDRVRTYPVQDDSQGSTGGKSSR